MRGGQLLTGTPRSDPAIADRSADWLVGIVGGDADPGTRLAALVHLARSAPDRTVGDLTSQATALLRAISAHPGYTAAPVDDRIALVADQLEQLEPGRCVDALRAGGRLIDCQHGPVRESGAAHRRSPGRA